MSTLQRTLARGSRRIALARFVGASVLTMLAGTAVLLGWRVAEKGFMAPAPDWGLAWGVTAGVALLASALWVWVTRPDREAVSMRLDEALGLKATLSTAAWALRDERSQGDAWRAATIDEGERAAARADVRGAIPVALPRYWGAPLVLAVLTLAGGWLPQQDVLSWFAPEEREERLAEAEREKEIIEIKQQVEEARRDLDAALSDLDDDTLDELLKQDEDIEEPRTPEELRAAELRTLTAVRDRLEEIERDAQAQTEALKEMTATIDIPEGMETPVTKMGEALKKGDFSEALEQLNELKKQLENGGLSEEQKRAMREQLQQLADQLQRAAEQNQQAMRELAEQAGLPPELANDPQALQQAIQNAQHLSEQQKQQLQQQLQQMQKASGQCQQCAGGMSQLAQSLGQAGQGGAMQGLQGQLSQMEMLEQQLKNAQAAKGQCQGAMAGIGKGQGVGQSQLPLWAQKQPLVQGGGGQGAGSFGRGGNEAGSDNSQQTVADSKKADTVVNPSGPIIGSMIAEGGEQIRGESVAQFREVAQAGGRAASDAIDEHRVPKEYEEIVKRYFGGLEKEAERASGENSNAAGEDNGS